MSSPTIPVTIEVTVACESGRDGESLPPALQTPPLIVPSIDQRYASATIEKSSRIQSRQALVQFSSAVLISGLTSLLALDTRQLREIADTSALMLSAGVALFGLVVTAWIGHQDVMISLLESYCQALEQYGKRLAAAPTDGDRVPCWHDRRSGWSASGFVARFWSDHAFGLVLLATAMPNAIILYENGYKEFALCLLSALLVLTFQIRFFVIPRVHLQNLKWKYNAVSVCFVLAIIVVMGSLFLKITPNLPTNARFHNPYLIGLTSTMLSAATLASYYWFERKRCLIFYFGSYDFQTGEFSYKPKPNAKPVL